MDESKITRWLLLPDVFQSVEDIKPSDVLPAEAINPPIITRWLIDSDTWSLPKPSDVFPISDIKETKVVQWDTLLDIWNIPPNIARCKILKIVPLFLYEKQHSSFIVEAIAKLDGNIIDFKVLVNGIEANSTSSINTLNYGENIIRIEAKDGGFCEVVVFKEIEHRCKVKRTFTSIDGGYLRTTVE